MNRNELDYLFEKMQELPEHNKTNLLCDLFARMEGTQQVNGAYFPEDFFQKVQKEVGLAREKDGINMKERELISFLGEYDMYLLRESDTKFAIKRSGIANPILFFRTDEEYRGGVIVKSINASLYSNEQIKAALLLVHYYLREQEVKQ